MGLEDWADGAGSAGGEARRSGGDVDGDAALAGSCLLRSASGGADRCRFRCFRRDDLQAVLRGEDGGAVDPAWPVLSDAHGRLLRGDRLRARDRMAVFGLALAQGVSASADDRSGAGSLLAVEDAEPPVARGSRGGVRLGAGADRRARPGEGERIGVDASTMEANAALRTIVRRDSGDTYREMLKRMAAENGIDTPSADYFVRLDRARKGNKPSNADWVSKPDPDAKIA